MIHFCLSSGTNTVFLLGSVLDLTWSPGDGPTLNSLVCSLNVP